MARLAKRMSQEQVAEKMHVSRATISAYENGIRAMNFSTVKDMCDICGFNYVVVLYKILMEIDPNMVKELRIDEDYKAEIAKVSK